MRLIDVSVLKEWVKNWFAKNRYYHPYAKNNNIPITELYDILEQMPSAQPEILACGEGELISNPDVPDTNAGDLISRQAAIDLLRKRLIETANNNVGFTCDAGQTFEDASERIRYWIDELPSAQPERPEQPESAWEYCAECDHIEMCRWYPYEGCEFRSLPSAQPDMAENLYLYKCYITDKDGLQHEVIHTGDIRRVTGWEI